MARIRAIKPVQLWSDAGYSLVARPRFLYCIAEIGREDKGPCKVGIATSMAKRLSALQGGNWRELVIVWQVRISDRERAKNAEQHCLMLHRPNCYGGAIVKRLKSEWVESTPWDALTTALKYLNVDEVPKFLRVA